MTSTEPFLGEIALFPYDFVPKNWAPCDGRLMGIIQNSALFSLLGTNFGGDGWNTFALPNLNGRVALGVGRGPGLTDYSIGEAGGQAEVTLSTSQLPAHHHGMRVATATASHGSPVDAVPAGAPVEMYNANATDQEALGRAGQSLPHPNIQPSLGLRYCIALAGIYPSQT